MGLRKRPGTRSLPLHFVGGTDEGPGSSHSRERTAVGWRYVRVGGCDVDGLHPFLRALLDTSEAVNGCLIGPSGSDPNGWD